MTSAGHCMVFARTDKKVLGYDLKAIVLMQLRFDGKFGFAGGLIEDSDASSVEGVSREMWEEMALDPKVFPLSDDNLVVSQSAESENLDQLHFYALQVAEHQILDIEKNSFNALHYGEEVLGWIRVPLYTMADGYNGLPAFLNQRFAGNARDQLLTALEKVGVLTKEEIELAMKASLTKT